MAKGKPIGTIFVELDLDATKYTRGQKDILAGAEKNSADIEKTFKRVGITSDKMYDAMRQNVKNSLDAILRSHTTSAAEKVRAEQGAADKIKRINEQQHGAQVSLLDRIKANWMSVAAGITAAYYALSRFYDGIKDVTLTAARFETMGIVMRVVGKNAGYSGAEMESFAKSLEKTGISMLSSRQTLTMMARAQLDLNKATELGRIAQDSAVIGNMNSSQAFEQMIYGIQTANVRVLRTIGINVQFKESYAQVAKELGRTVASLSETEKAAIRMNEVIESGKTIAGTYEAAMGTAGKQLLSLERHMENLKVLIGAAFTPALAEAVEIVTGAVVGLNNELSDDAKDSVHEWGVKFRLTIISIEAEIMRLAMFIDKVGGTLSSISAFGGALNDAAAALLGKKGTMYQDALALNASLQKSYNATEVELQKLADRYVALEDSISVAGKAEAKAKKDAADRVKGTPVKAGAGAVDETDTQKAAQKAFVQMMTERAEVLNSFYGDAAELSKIASEMEIKAFGDRMKEREKMEADSYKARFDMAKEYEDSLRKSQEEESTISEPVKGYGFGDAMGAAESYGNVALAIQTMNSELGATQAILEENRAYIGLYETAWRDANLAIADSMMSLYGGMTNWISSSLQGLIEGTMKVADVLKNLGSMMLQVVTEYIAKWIVATTTMFLLGEAKKAASTATSIAAAAVTAAAWAAPAALVSAASFGAAPAAGTAGLMATFAAAVGIASGMAGAAHGGLDYVPAETTYLLDKGERVVSPKQNKDLTDFLGGKGGDKGGGMGQPIILQLDGEVLASWFHKASRTGVVRLVPA